MINFIRRILKQLIIKNSNLISADSEDYFVINKSHAIKGIITRDKYQNKYYIPILGLSNNVINQLASNGNTYDKQEDIDLLLQNFQGEIMLDIGSNHGVLSISLCTKFNKIIAFEPESDNCEVLERNLQLNDCNNIDLVKLAVSNANGITHLNKYESHGHHSLAQVYDSTKTISTVEVNTVTLDHYCRQNGIAKIDFLKVDVEGFEYYVFEGASGLLKDKKIGAIMFEISEVPLSAVDKSAKDIAELLNSYEYSIYDLQFNLIQDYRALDKVFFSNFLAIPNDSHLP